MLFACGPSVEEPPPEDWQLGEWFVLPSECPNGCKTEILVQLEIEPDGVARIYRESTCHIEMEDAVTWVEEEVGSLRFEPVSPGGRGLLGSPFEFFLLRRVDDCSARGEELDAERLLIRGPVKLLPGEQGDCHGPIVADGDPRERACLDDVDVG